ncbi:MAG: NAD kinase [Flavobacteriales bacterium]|nr:NAD kinase [Flavobacteriales bacterium]
MKIGIYSRVLKTGEHLRFFRYLIELLQQNGIEACVYDTLAGHLEAEHRHHCTQPIFKAGELRMGSLDFLISLGGDGTMLDTLSIVRDTGIPVLGVNTGRFGFLASSQMSDIEVTISELENRSYSLEERTVLKLECHTELFDGFPYALNDFVLHKKDSSAMITVHTYLNGMFLNSYWSDGLIISTPTGSSGYSLSCGGPLLFPGSSSFVVTPIAPHNLNVRPVVVSDSNIISFEFEGRTNSVLASLDSRAVSLLKGIELAIRKADFGFRMVRLSGENYMDTIRKKLMWGRDNRN